MKTFSILTLLLFTQFAFAQNDAIISGKATDEKAQPILLANALAFNAADTSLAKATAVNEDGSFQIEGLNAGNYLLQVMAFGYEKKFTPVSLKNGENKNVGTISINPETVAMEGVEVVFTRPLVEVRPDKTVFNVEGTINSTGQNALDLLRRAPGVFVDKDENVMLKGRSDVQVWIDGKPSPITGDQLAAMLKGMQSDNIDSIELISNPSAKYDAAGTAGIINIKLKKNKNFGTNGSANLGYRNGLGTGYNGSITLNNRTKAANVFGTYSYNDGVHKSWMNLYREQGDKIFDQYGTMNDDNWNHFIKAGADFYLGEKNTLGFVASGNLSEGALGNLSNMNIGPLNNIDHVLLQTDSTLTANNLSTNERNNGNFNLNYQWADTSGTTLSMDADYGIYRFSTTTDQPNTYADPTTGEVIAQNDYRTVAPTNIDIYSFKADYERNALKGQIGFGVKLSMVSTDNIFDFFTLEGGEALIDSTQSSEFVYDENINAAYFNYKRQLKKLGVQLGLRVENTASHGVLTPLIDSNDPENDVKRSYTDIFPNAAFSYNPNMMNAFNFSYSRRIDRPTYQDLNPFLFKLDELSYMKGNPFLKPQYVHNTELSWTYKYMYNTALSYAYTKDFSTMNLFADGQASYIEQTNLGSQQYASITFSAPIQLMKWWSMYVSSTAYYLMQEADFTDQPDIKIGFGSYNFFGQNSFTLPKGFTFELSGWLNGPGIWGGTFENKPMGSMDCGLKKTFMKEMASFKVAYSDLLRTAKWRGISDYNGQYLDARGGWDSRVWRFDFSMRFGNQQIKTRKHQSGADDLNKRVK